MDKKTTMLMILDGFGINERTEGNAVKLANIPNINNLYYGKYPHTICHTSGRDVGLPDGQMGNSEVGHTNIGAGRIVYQELTSHFCPVLLHQIALIILLRNRTQNRYPVP